MVKWWEWSRKVWIVMRGVAATPASPPSPSPINPEQSQQNPPQTATTPSTTASVPSYAEVLQNNPKSKTSTQSTSEEKKPHSRQERSGVQLGKGNTGAKGRREEGPTGHPTPPPPVKEAGEAGTKPAKPPPDRGKGKGAGEQKWQSTNLWERLERERK